MFARLRGRTEETFPDGRGVVHQPMRLILAFRVLSVYWSENDGDAVD